MGQVPSSWCGEGLAVNSDLAVWTSGSAMQPSDRPQSTLRGQEDPPPMDAERLLVGCPRDLADALRETGQWGVLRCRPWLSAGALRTLQRSLQCCSLRQLADRHREAEAPEECTYSQPMAVPWKELDLDHVVSAGQVFRVDDAPNDKVVHLRRVGMQAIRQGKVAIALLAGGANLRLGVTEPPPVGCMNKHLGLPSGKSILQLSCERVRRVASLCCVGLEANSAPSAGAASATTPREKPGEKPVTRVSIPVFVMTSRLTHRNVVDHFESHGYFGLPPRDVFFFEQPVVPMLDEFGHLLPQSLGGEFAHAPGGTGQALRALAGSSALEQMRDRGVECLHILGTENILARVCDPVFIGFCRDLDIDCACKTVERMDPTEDLELFCVRQSPVSTQFADIEDAACGLDLGDAPHEVLTLRNASGKLSYAGSVNSVFMAVSYVEEVVGRPIRAHRLARAMPYLDFHLEPPTMEEDEKEEVEIADASNPDCADMTKNVRLPTGVAVGSWPAETASPDLACQRALLAAAAEIRIRMQNQTGPEDLQESWRCDVHLDCAGPLAVVRVRNAERGPPLLARSLAGPGGAETVAAAVEANELLRCSLVVPMTPNAFVLETSILDYFAYTDRAVAFQVPREREFAPVRDCKGSHTAAAAKRTLHQLHCSWVICAGASLPDAGDNPDALLEVSPLVSYEGEGMGPGWDGPITEGSILRLPYHVAGPDEVTQPEPGSPNANTSPDDAADGLDTRPFYLQEYPRRPEVSSSHVPKFLKASGDAGTAMPSPRVGEGV